MKTLQLMVDPTNLKCPEAQETLEQAAQILRVGGLVAFPTETVYGLGANALDAEAVARIFEAKRRPSWDPIIVHIADEAMLDGIVREVPDAARKLIKAFWPGPLTLLLPRIDVVPDVVTAGRPLVGIRMPSHPVALEFIRRAGVPVAAPSANLFSYVSPTTAAHVLADLDGRIDAVLDGGATEHGVESTVMDPCQSPMAIYRSGAVTSAQISLVAGAVEIFRGGAGTAVKPGAVLPAPGMALRHYAPSARLMLIDAELADVGARFAQALRDLPGERVGVMLPAEVVAPVGAVAVHPWGRWEAPEEMAHELYSGLRALDAIGCTVILCPVPPVEGIGLAIRDRLAKAAYKAEKQESKE
jgi:L-threonylcarbamoyladenylate synthase